MDKEVFEDLTLKDVPEEDFGDEENKDDDDDEDGEVFTIE